MKHLLLTSVLVSAIFISCKKDRTCSCSMTKTGTSTTKAALTVSVPVLGNVPVVDTSFVTPVNEVQNYDRTLMDVNKRSARQNCVSYKEPYDETIVNAAPPLLITTQAKGEKVYTCDLK